LALYDRLQMIIFGKKFGSGEGWTWSCKIKSNLKCLSIKLIKVFDQKTHKLKSIFLWGL
jgi:hypothetical protein